MQVAIELGGRTTTVEVADDLESVTVDGRRFPCRVVARSALRVELEIAGEKVVVDQWPEHFPSPPSDVSVDGELWSISVRSRESGSRTVAAPPSAPTPAAAPPQRAGGVPVVPPMPGRVIEVRVREGDRVARGDLLLVLEAMKMRNELTSPADGIVRGLCVSAGTNARAREPMLYVSPD